MALRLTSNLLYGVALIYKQKTDYLNNDTSLIKTKIQRDLFNQKGSSSDILIKTPNYIIKPIELTKTQQGGNHNNQVLLNDDPLFNLEGDLLPSLDDLGFLQGTSSTQMVNSNHRKSQIKRSDLENNTVSVVLSTMTNSTEDADIFTRHVNHDDILDTQNPEFAFDEEGMLFSLHDETTAGTGGHAGPSENLHINDGFDIDFDFDIDLERQEASAQQQPPELDQILEEVEDPPPQQAPDSEQPIVNEPSEAVQQPRKKRRKAQNHFTTLVVDETISLQTNDLRGFRDTYIELMDQQRTKPPEPRITIQNLLDEVSYLPNFGKNIADEERRGRNPVREFEDEDFVDGLLRNTRRSSESIEVRRNASSSRRHSTRASMSSINLPLEGDLQHPQIDDTTGGGGNDNFDFDFDLEFDIDEERVSRKRSSSVQRFPALAEDEEHNYQNNEEMYDDEEPEVDRKTIKFLTFIETRLEEDSVQEMKFDQLMQHQQNRSVIVKSFYELLQLTTLNSIEIVENNDKEKFELLDANDFSIRLV